MCVLPYEFAELKKSMNQTQIGNRLLSKPLWIGTFLNLRGMISSQGKGVTGDTVKQQMLLLTALLDESESLENWATSVGQTMRLVWEQQVEAAEIHRVGRKVCQEPEKFSGYTI